MYVVPIFIVHWVLDKICAIVMCWPFQSCEHEVALGCEMHDEASQPRTDSVELFETPTNLH